MLHQPIRMTVTIATTSAAAPFVAGAAASWSGAETTQAVQIAIGVGVLSVGAGAMLIRRSWRGPIRSIHTLSDMLNRGSATVTGLDDLAAQFKKKLAQDRRSLDAANTEIIELRALFDALGDPVIATDNAETVVFANRAAAEFLRVEPSKLLGAPAERSITQASLLGALRRALAGERHTTRIDLATHRGARITEVTSAPIGENGRSSGAAMILRDVTDLARAARMKTDFVANASHELRTPLAAIRAALDTARTAGETDPKLMRRFIDMTPAHLLRLEELTRDLIDLSRLESQDLRLRVAPIRLADEQSAILTLFDDVARGKSVELRIELDPALEGFRTDFRLVPLILKNLIDNALKFCHEHTVVRIIGTLETTSDGRRRARFEIRDRGVGIPLSQQQRVFERFYQVDPAKLGIAATSAPPRRGSGLGLSIVKHAVGALGGEVGIESVYQEGTIVWFLIPEQPDQPESDRDSAA